MTIFINLVILVIGFVLLIKGADFFVEGSAAIARKLRVPALIIGLTIVAMGTSAPEMAVSVSAALEGSNEIAVSNVTGSNIFNLLVVLGICAAMAPLPSDENIVKRDYPFMLVITAVLIVMTFGSFLGSAAAGGINSTEVCGFLNRTEGIILLVLFVGYLYFTVRYAMKVRNDETDEEYMVFFKNWQIAAYVIGGLIAIVIGGKMVVGGAKSIALLAGMTETLVGLTIVAVGTSLPELVTSVIAARKGENELAMGNIIGSNIFNILFILGVSSTITPIYVNVQAVADIIIAFLMCAVVFVFAKTRKSINRAEGIAMLAVYVVYMVYAIMR